MITFGQPIYILAGGMATLGFLLLSRSIKRYKHRKLQQFATEPLLTKLLPMVSERRRTIKTWLLSGAVLCCFIALARPQYGFRWIDVTHKGIDMLFAIDTSNSMRAEDIKPNRLDRSKLAIMDFVNQLNGDRVGLLPFAGSAYLICPLTSDYRAFEHSLMAIDTSIITPGGTNIGRAIADAERVLSNDANHKILIMLSDGENLQGNAIKAALNAQDKGLTIFTVGIGTPQGELIPAPEHGGYLQDEQGTYIKSRLDTTELTDIARTTGGFYVPLGDHGQGLEKIYQQKLALLPQEVLQEKRKKVPLERYQWPVGLALFLVITEFLLASTKTSVGITRFRRKRSSSLAGNVLLLVLSSTLLGFGAPRLLYSSEGDQAYRDGNYGQAQKFYLADYKKHPAQYELLYNAGSASYRQGNFNQAVESFQQSLQTANLLLQEKAYYNLGNAYYRHGETTLKTNPSATIDAWQAALTSYHNSLALNPENQRATHNHQLVARKLAQLKRQQSPPQPPPQSQPAPEQNPEQNEAGETDSHQGEHQQDDETEEASDGVPDNNRSAQQPEQTAGQPAERDQSDQPAPGGKNREQANPKQPKAMAQADTAPAINPEQAPSSPGEKQSMSRQQAEQLLDEMAGEEGGILDLLDRPEKPKQVDSLKNW